MVFFAEKVRRVVPGNFTFVVMTDREDLDDQIWRTFIGCGVTDEKTPRAGSGKGLKAILRENHRFVFSLVHKFNQDVKEAYSKRDDIIVLSDEAHRTQAGKLARNMRQAHSGKDDVQVERLAMDRVYKWVYAESRPRTRLVVMSENHIVGWARNLGVPVPDARSKVTAENT